MCKSSKKGKFYTRGYLERKETKNPAILQYIHIGLQNTTIRMLNKVLVAHRMPEKNIVELEKVQKKRQNYQESGAACL